MNDTERSMTKAILKMTGYYETGGSMNEDKPGPGKFEDNRSGRESRALHALANMGLCDAEAGGVEDGYWVGLVIPGTDELASPAYVLTEDSQGFFTVRPFETRIEAEAVYAMFVADLPTDEGDRL